MTSECVRKVDEREATAPYQATAFDTKWIDTDTALEVLPTQIRLLQVSSKVTTGQICTQKLLRWKRLEAIILIAASHKETFSIMHIDVSRAYFYAKAQRLVLVRFPLEDRMGSAVGNRSVEKEHVWHTGRGKQLGA